MQIPQSDILSTNAMNRVFDTTTATYKFYWLLALLDMHVKEQKDEMLALDVADRMVAYAWYPTQYFRLSFGKGDSMSKIIPDMAQLTGITVDDRLEDKNEAISNAISEDREVKKKVKILLNNVPFRFQKPWIDTTDDSEMQRRSQSFENDWLYSLTGSGEGLTATIHTRYSEQFLTDLKKHDEQYPEITFVQLPHKNHDRFLIIDNKAYLLGTSVKDIGAGLCAVTELSTSPETILEMLK